MHELKDDVRDYFQWAANQYPEKDGEIGINFLLWELSSNLQELNRLINDKAENNGLRSQ